MLILRCTNREVICFDDCCFSNVFKVTAKGKALQT